jgi:CotS family spore coat protein
LAVFQEVQASKEPVNQVLSKYNIEIMDSKTEVYKGKKGVWWIYTKTGEMVLKKVSNSEATLRFILAGINYLEKNGIRIPEVIRTREGKEYVCIDKTCFVLSKAIKGKKLNADNLLDIESMAKEMGRFHKASYGFMCPFGAKAKNHLGSWIDEYNGFIEDMNVFYINEKSNRNRNMIGNMIIKEFPYFYERGKRAIEGLKGEEYREWVRKVNKEGCLCHQDFSTANLVMAVDGIYVLDTDSLTIDIPARDIRKLLNKVMKKNSRWDIDTVKEIITAYNNENKLLKSEWKVVSLDLMFPHLFLGAMDKYYYNRDKTWNEEDYYKRLNEMVLFEKTINPIINWFGLNENKNIWG